MNRGTPTPTIVKVSITALLVVLTAAAVGVVTCLELRQPAEATASQRDYAAAGGFVAIVSGQSHPLDAARCVLLNGRPGVVAAGGVRTSGTVSFTSAPGVLFQSAEVSGRVLPVWAPDAVIPAPAGGPSVVAGAALAAELGIHLSAFVQVEGEKDVERLAPSSTPNDGTRASSAGSFGRYLPPGLSRSAGWSLNGKPMRRASRWWGHGSPLATRNRLCGPTSGQTSSRGT